MEYEIKKVNNDTIIEGFYINSDSLYFDTDFSTLNEPTYNVEIEARDTISGN